MLALIFALLVVAFTIHDLDRRAGVDGYSDVVSRRFPAVVKGCRVATGVTMAFILITMT
jgi:hypothetical protein